MTARLPMLMAIVVILTVKKISCCLIQMSKGLLDLPRDILDAIVDFMDVCTFAKFRQIYRQKWSQRQIKRFGNDRMRCMETKHSEYPNHDGMSFQKNMPQTCAHCRHGSISFIEWEDGLGRRSIPWCPLHVPASVMDNVKGYCLEIHTPS